VFTYLDLDFQKYVKHDSQFFRASELIPLCGNSAKAQEQLGWHNMTPFKEMVKNMIDVELDQYNKTR
jgi:GDPmannose 4,6-dehydratase